jgi:hypothetical protein
MTAVTVETIGAKLTADESKLAAGIGAALAAELSKAIDGVERGMQAIYTPMVKSVKGRQLNMAKAILREAVDALESAGKPAGTVMQIRTVILHHIAAGEELPKLYKDARIAYNERPKAGRKPRQPKAPSVTTTEPETTGGEGEGLEVVDGTPAANPNSAQLRILMQAWQALNAENRTALLNYAQNLHAEQALATRMAEDAAESEELDEAA